MRPYLVILIFFGVLLQSISKVLIVAEYALNKEYISRNICENRDKPKMNCKGKCHLKKQLAEEENGKRNLQSQLEKQEVNLFFQYSEIRMPLPAIPVLRQKFVIADDFLLLNFIKNIFHPPSHSFSF